MEPTKQPDSRRVADHLTTHPGTTVAALVLELRINKNRVYNALAAINAVSRREGKYSLWYLPPSAQQKDNTRAQIAWHLAEATRLLERL